MNAPQPDPGIISPQMQALLEKVAAETGPQPDPSLLPAAEGRAVSARNNRRWNVNLPEMAAETEVWIPADPTLGSERCRIRILTPDNAGCGIVFFVHGGGFAFCSPETHERCARVLANETRMPVAMPDYRLAPENPFPAGLLDVVACLRALLDGRVDGPGARPFFVSGDFTITRRKGEWEFLETPELQSAKQEIRKLNGALDVLSDTGHAAFTARERVVLAQLVRGYSSKEIARTLGITPRTVEFHRANLLKKGNARSTVHLVRIVLGE